jgi:hypothetical protein
VFINQRTDKENVVFTHNGYYSATKKNKIISLARKMDRIGDHHVKPGSERQITCFLSYVNAEYKKSKI